MASWLPFVLFGLAVWHFWDAGIDDAGISWRYARHLAEGHGLRWNLTGPPVEGYSNFLWVLMLAGCRTLGLDIQLASKILGVIFSVFSLAMLRVLCRRLWGDLLFWWMPVLLTALMPEWTMWAMSGLEISLFGCLLVGTILALSSQRLSTTWLALCLSALVLTRPEGVGIALVVIVARIAVPGERSWRERLRELVIPAAVVVVVAAAMVVFRLLYFGYPLPNTVYAKFTASLPSWPQVLRWLWFAEPFAIAWAVAIWRERNPARRGLLVLIMAVLVFHTAMILPVATVMNFLHRYHAALIPLLLLPVPALLGFLRRWGAPLAMLTTILLVVWSLQGLMPVEQRVALERRCQGYQRCIADDLAALPGHPTIALQDAGRIPYWCDLPAIDTWGLCDLDIARNGFTPEELMRRAPEVYVTSADSIHLGIVEPHQGVDKWVILTPGFLDQYQLWRHCLTASVRPGEPYSYAILLDIQWAKSHGIAFPSPRIQLIPLDLELPAQLP